MAKSKKNTKLFEWQKKAALGGTCERCGVQGRLTVDHIVPVSILYLLDETGEAAYEDEENFQFLCNPCNGFKSCKLEKRNPKTKIILLKYLKEADL